MDVSQNKIRMWFYYKIKMWKRASGLDCKSESKSRDKFKQFKFRELIELERVFKKNHYPDKNIRKDLAQRIGVSEVKIHTWFFNKRYKLKKHALSLTYAEGDNFITSSSDDVNYPPVPFYSRAETMLPDYPHPQLQSRPDFSAAFSDGVCVCARARARVCVCVCV